MGKSFVINVPVATIWTSHDSPRELDQQAVSYPANIEGWIKSLSHDQLLDLCNHNLVQTQVLLGQKVEIISEHGEWVEVVIPEQPSSKQERGYPGWMPKRQLSEVDEWNVEQSPLISVIKQTAWLYDEEDQPLLHVSFQTRLPVVEELGTYIRVRIPQGTARVKKEDITFLHSVNELPRGNGEGIVGAGKAFIGLPYLWGGMSGFGFDCSGFSYTMCKANGIMIARDAHDQAAAGESVPFHQLKPGDLLFFAYEEGKGKLHHVGIYYGNGEMIHAPQTGKGIEVIELKGTIYEKELCHASRYWK
ncbi:C40 family peptidase [Priestia koreensis]|uniref:Peptidase n=1 Tax=Priestia koreensis TaxID=284581 RepID=A0A0M0LI75_9BACI|nr:C40 family peptidase [Priestia koreensis]KOO50759.1 peptidase [Priestia koreensis]